MLENEEILFENLLEEPETTRPDEIILGDGANDSCLKYGCDTDSCSSHTCGTFECNIVLCSANACGTFTCKSDCASDCGSDCASNCQNVVCTSQCASDCTSDCTSDCPLDGDVCRKDCQLDSCASECSNYGYTCGSDGDNNPCYGYNCPGDGCTNYGTGTVPTYYRYYVGFRINLRGTYSVLSSMVYTLENYTFNSRLQASNGNVSKPLCLMGFTYIQNKLATATTNGYGEFDIMKSGVTTFYGNTGSNLNACICGVTIPINAPTGKVYAEVASGRLKYVSSTKHASKTYIPISCFTMVQRVTSSTVGGNNQYWDIGVAKSGRTRVNLYEKPVIVIVNDNANTNYLLQGAEVKVTSNSGGLATNVFSTGSYGYVRTFTSGNTATGFTVQVTRSGYTVATQTFTYHTTSANPVNHINQAAHRVSLSKSYWEAPNLSRLKMGLLNVPFNTVAEKQFQCHTPSQLYSINLSAVTGNIKTQTTYTGNSLGRFVDIKSFKNSPVYDTDDYIAGKESIFYYKPGVKSSTGLTNYQEITSITYNCGGFKIQTPKIAISASTDYHVGNCQVAFRLAPITGGPTSYDFIYSEPISGRYVVIPSLIFSYSPDSAIHNSQYTGFKLWFAVVPIEPPSITNQVTAKTVSDKYYYRPKPYNPNIINPSGYTPSP